MWFVIPCPLYFFMSQSDGSTLQPSEAIPSSLATWTAAAARDQLDSWSAALLQDGLARDRADLVEAADRVAEATIAVAPALHGPYRRLVQGLTRLQGSEAALARLVALADQYPDVPWPVEEVVGLLRELGRWVEAAAWGRRAAAVHASPGWFRIFLAERQARP
jgi:hypothetical protein